jgi:hypothetical protein
VNRMRSGAGVPIGTSFASNFGVKVRICRTPELDELDGVRLDDMTPGSVREVSPSIGAWLVAERCAEPEMRRDVRAHQEDFLTEPDGSAAVVTRSLHRRLNEHR